MGEEIAEGWSDVRQFKSLVDCTDDHWVQMNAAVPTLRDVKWTSKSN
jgi:hypothetical protein